MVMLCVCRAVNQTLMWLRSSDGVEVMGVEWVGVVGAMGVAMVTGLFGVLISRLRKENTEQHAANQAKLEMIAGDVVEMRDDVREVRSAQQRHLEWHAEVA